MEVLLYLRVRSQNYGEEIEKTRDKEDGLKWETRSTTSQYP